MPLLLTGPRLGPPSQTGFTLWCQAVTTGTYILDTREDGTTTWVTQDTQAIDGTKSNTVVLTASGLTPGTKYDYRIMEGAAERSTNSTWTMPASGRFVVFECADQHGKASNLVGFTDILSYWETNYEPDGIPGFILQIGDFASGSGITTAASGVNNWIATLGTSDVEDCLARLPVAFQWDDWDYGGDNSSSDWGDYDTMPDDAETVADHIWRDRPQPASPSYGYSFTVANVPFIIPEDRSQRITKRDESDDTDYVPHWSGDEYPNNPNHTCFGSAQREWLKAQFVAYADRGLVVLTFGGTLKDPIATGFGTGVGARDSASLYYKSEVNDILKVAHDYGYSEKNSLLVFTGDDHHSYCLDWTLGAVSKIDDTTVNRPPVPVGPNFREVKTAMRAQVTAGGLGSSAFGNGVGGDRVLWHGRSISVPGSFALLDITSSANGRYVTAVLKILRCTDGDFADGDPTYDGYDPHWLFINGHWSHVDSETASTTTLAENAPGPQRRNHDRAFVDEIMGTLHPESSMLEDRDQRLRLSDDIDDFDHEEWREITTIRTEYEPPEP